MVHGSAKIKPLLPKLYVELCHYYITGVYITYSVVADSEQVESA